MRYLLILFIPLHYLISSPLDDIYGEIDKSLMQTQYLYDKQLHFVDPLNYSGDLQNDSISNWFKFNDLSYQFSQSSISNENDFKDREELQENKNSPYLLFSSYDKIKNDVLEKEYFYLEDGILKDSIGRINNPFEQKECFSFVFLNDKIYKKKYDRKVTFQLDNKLIQSNKDINNYKIDFGQGNGYQELRLGDTISVEFASIGTKEIKFKIEVNGKKYESKTIVEIIEEEDPSVECDNCEITFIDNGKALLTTWLSTCNKNGIKRPIIFVDGFDPMLDDTDYYGGLHAKEFKLLLNDYANGLHDRLLENGFDVVFVDFRNGGDRIENNALLLEKVLDNFNDPNRYDLSSDIKLVGISMGGLVSRYCLAQMQEKNKKHNVGLWMTIDTPHQGAYIPWGIKNTIYFNNDYFKKYMPSEALNGLKRSMAASEAPAAKQMLMPHESLKMKNNYDNTFDWAQFYLRLSSMPFPMVNKTIAFTNGSLKGVRQKRYVTPSERFLPTQKYFHHNSELDAWLLFTELEYKIDLNALPEVDYNSPGEYRYSRNEYELNSNILGIGVSTIDSKKVSKKVKNDIGPSFETIPGGYRRTNVDVEKAFSFLANFGLNPHRDEHTIYKRKNHCFIPTASSLDLRSPSGQLADVSLWSKNISSALNNHEVISPFDEIYGLNYFNTPHALAEPIEDDFIKEEMYYLLDKLFDKSLVPNYLKLQNDVINNVNQNYFESINKISVGEFVDSEKSYGKFIIKDKNEVHFKAKNKIQFKKGTYFNSGSFVSAKLENVFKSCENESKISLGSDNHQDKSDLMFVYPNPANESINLELKIEESEIYSLTLYDLTGKILLKFIENDFIKKGSYYLNYSLRDLINGSYILIIESENSLESYKLLIER